jgi:CheY-like chemotaxis protein
MSQRALNDPRESVQWTQQSVLLIDGSQRRDERALSLRQAGLMVHCASDGASAAALWETAKYQLVLVELSNAENDVRPFCRKLMERSPRQRMGIFSPDRPFIRQPSFGCFSAESRAATESLPEPLQDALVADQQPDTGLAPENRASLPSTRGAAFQRPISDRRLRFAAATRKGRNGLAHAAQEIAALRWQNQRNTAPAGEPVERPNRESLATSKPESHAAVAARVLGGE